MSTLFQNIMQIPRTYGMCNEFATDTFEYCRDKEYFQNYKKEITYKFNTHGYRDDEWPTDLENIVWCLGDSATLGVGQPFDDTWPQMLQKILTRRCLNIGQEMCSNDTIRLRAEFISKNYKPTNMVIMWSFFHRRRKNGVDIQYDESDFGMEADLKNFAYNFSKVQELNTKIMHFTIPGALMDNKHFDIGILEYLFTKFNLPGKNNLKQINTFDQVDYGRDHMHWGTMTSQNICSIIKNSIVIDNSSKYPV
jgi:hypothetical protein